MKCFLSHSSDDKARYVDIVADKLKGRAIYDKISFEEGNKTLGEILDGIKKSELFVLFISESALESTWVKNEILIAKNSLDEGTLKKFFPIIIDPSITHIDDRIPKWLRRNYNLRPVTKPTIAARRIEQKLLELVWQKHPDIEKRDQLFVGRNDLINEFEKRFDDFRRPNPCVVIASGVKEIGRRSFLINALKKSNEIKATYNPIIISLEQEDGIESLIQSLYDLGATENLDINNLLDISINEKVEIVLTLLSDLTNLREKIIIQDNACIIKYDSKIVDWFQQIVSKLPVNKCELFLASRCRANLKPFVRNTRYCFFQIPELNEFERVGLLRRYAELRNIEISPETKKDISRILTGFPGQVLFAVDSIAEMSESEAIKDLSYLSEYSTYRAQKLINKYEGDKNKLSLLRFMASFDFMSMDFINQIAERTEIPCIEIIGEFMTDSICERVGPEGEYIRLNDVVRDYAQRTQITMKGTFRKALEDYVDDFLATYQTQEYDVSEYFVSIQTALASGKVVPDNLLTPAHFLKTLKALYSSQKYKQLVMLADRILVKSYNYDKYTELDIRYYLCQALAWLQDGRFLEEVQYVRDDEHDFLLGFFYRIVGNYEKSIISLKKAMQSKSAEQRARRELVHVYALIDEYDKAMILAKVNYEKYPDNHFIIQSYLNCLIYGKPVKDRYNTALMLVKKLQAIPGRKAQEMAGIGLALCLAFLDKNQEGAISQINKIIKRNKNSSYCLLAKLEIASHFYNLGEVKNCINQIQQKPFSKSPASKIKLAKARALVFSLTGEKPSALNVIETELKQLSPASKKRFIAKLNSVNQIQPKKKKRHYPRKKRKN